MEDTKDQSLRILLASREDLRGEVAQALPGSPGDHRVFWVSEAELLLSRVPDLAPQVILLDQDLAQTKTPSLVRQLCVRAPRAAVLLLITPEQLPAANQAVLAGARAFALKPIQSEELSRTLNQVFVAPRAPAAAAAQRGQGQNGRVLVFVAPKGGTGRTTLAINTAISLRLCSKAPVAMVDADYAAPALDVALNLGTQHTIAELLPRLQQLDEAMVSGMMETHTSGIQVLTAPPPQHLKSAISLPQVQQILVVLKRMFPWIIVDLGLPMDDTAFAFLEFADRIVMTVWPEMIALRNTRLMIEQLRSRGCPEEKIWLVVNRATIPGGLSAYDIESRLHIKVRYCIPDDQPLATRSINRGVPMAIYNKRSAVAHAVMAMAQLIHTDPTLVRESGQGVRPASRLARPLHAPSLAR